MIKKLAWTLVLIGVILIVSNWKLAMYGLKQAKGQLSITFNTVPVESILKDTLIQDSIKWKIEIVQEARLFAFDDLGLSESDNYTTFYDQQESVSLWNLSASKPYALEPKTWSFPFLGSFPYKGFFDIENAKKELEDLKVKGYDARIRPVGGWSTLGWTTDPILSNMLERPEGALAELIIHELTHSTLFIKDNIAFNENLASFIGEKGAVLFLENKYGRNSEAYFEYIMSEEDGIMFRNQMLIGTEKLDSLYKLLDASPDSVKAIAKHTMIDQVMASIDTLHFHNPRYYQVFENSRPNNAYFMSYLRYYSAKDSLQDILKDTYDDNLKQFIEGMKAYHE